jgi:hypothetical protein
MTAAVQRTAATISFITFPPEETDHYTDERGQNQRGPPLPQPRLPRSLRAFLARVTHICFDLVVPVDFNNWIGTLRLLHDGSPQSICFPDASPALPRKKSGEPHRKLAIRTEMLFFCGRAGMALLKADRDAQTTASSRAPKCDGNAGLRRGFSSPFLCRTACNIKSRAACHSCQLNQILSLTTPRCFPFFATALSLLHGDLQRLVD